MLTLATFILLWVYLKYLLMFLIIFWVWYSFRAQGNAFVLTMICKIFLRSLIKHFSLQKISYFPLQIDGLEVTTVGTSKRPEITISLKQFTLSLHILTILYYLFQQSMSWIWAFSPEKLHFLTFNFIQMHVSSPSIQFKDFLQPSSSKLTASYTNNPQSPQNNTTVITYQPLNFVKQCIKFFLPTINIHFQDISFDFKMPVHTCVIQGTADIMRFSFESSKHLPQESVTLVNIIQGGTLEITENNERAVLYCGHAARIHVDFHLITENMDVKINLYGHEDDVAIAIQPFLSFYHKYQHAEDESIEMKLVRGLPTGGKMSFSVDFEYMKLGITDTRHTNLLIIYVEKCHAELITFKLLMDSLQRCHKNKLCGISASLSGDAYYLPELITVPVLRLSKNMEKSMKAKVHSMIMYIVEPECMNHGIPNQKYLHIEQISFEKTLFVRNELDFIDQDTQKISVQSVFFHQINENILNWLIILQLTSNCLPISRFNHLKNQTMNVQVNELHVSLPSVKLIDPLILETNDESYVEFHCQHMTVEKQGKAGVLDSPYSISIEFMEIITWLLIKKLTDYYHISLLTNLQKNPLMKSSSSMSYARPRGRSNCLHTSPNINNSSTMSMGEHLPHSTSPHTNSQYNTYYHFFEMYASTGSRWEFRQFLCKFDLGTKITFKEVQCQDFAIYLLNNVLSKPAAASSASATASMASSSSSPSSHKVYSSAANTANTAATTKKSTQSLSRIKSKRLSICIPNSSNLHQHTSPSIHNQSTKPGEQPPQGQQKTSSTSPQQTATPTNTTNTTSSYEQNEHIFLTLQPFRILWLPSHPTDQSKDTNLPPRMTMQADLGQLQINGSVAGFLKWKYQFDMIKKTVDYMNYRMDQIKRMSSTVPLPPPPPAPPSSDLKIHVDNCFLGIAVRNQSIRSSSKSSSTLFDDFDFDELKEPNITTIFKLQHLDYITDNSIEQSKYAFAFCEIYLNNRYLTKPFLLIQEFAYTKQRVQRMIEVPPSLLATTVTSLPTFKSPRATTRGNPGPVLVPQMINVQNVEIGHMFMIMHEEMEIGLIVEDLLQQEAAFKVANTIIQKTNIPVESQNIPSSTVQTPTKAGHVVALPDSPSKNLIYGELGAETFTTPDLNKATQQIPQVNDPMKEEIASISSHSSSSMEDMLFQPFTNANNENKNTAMPWEFEDEFLDVEEDDDDNDGLDSMDELDDIIQEEILVDSHVSSNYNPNTLHIHIKEWRIKVQGNFQEEFQEQLFLLVYQDIIMDIDATKLPELQQEDISNLDVGLIDELSPEAHMLPANSDLLRNSFLTYQSIQGGDVNFLIDNMKIELAGQQDVFFEAKLLHWKGLMYAASIKDDRVPLEYRLIDLTDSIILSPDEENPLVTIGQSIHADLLYVILAKGIAPTKVYMDLDLHVQELIIHFYPTSMDCINAINQVMEVCLPPNRDPSPSLAFFDNLRYWMHGEFSLAMDRLSFYHHPQVILTQTIVLLTRIDSFSSHFDTKSIELMTKTIDVSGTITMTQLATRGVRNTARKRFVKQRQFNIARIPNFIFALRHSLLVYHPTSFSSSSSSSVPNNNATTASTGTTMQYRNHHDVYLHPALTSQGRMLTNPTSTSSFSSLAQSLSTINTTTTSTTINNTQSLPQPNRSYPNLSAHSSIIEEQELYPGFVKYVLQNQYCVDGNLSYIDRDKFYYFRSRKFSIAWDIEMRFADQINEAVYFNFRLDNLLEVLFQPLAKSPSTTPNPSPRPSVLTTNNPATTKTESNAAKRTVLRKEKKLPNVGVTNIVQQIQVQFIINKMFMSSWPSSSNLNGITCVQDLADMQIRIVRGNMETYNKLIHWIPHPESKAAHKSPNNEKVESNKTSKRINSESVTVNKVHIHGRKRHDRTNKQNTLKLINDFNIMEQDYGLQIDHLFIEIDVGEIYIREWNLYPYFDYEPDEFEENNTSRKFLLEPSMDINQENVLKEPNNAKEIMKLFHPVFKLAHASKVVISLTENGQVTSRSNAFRSTGILKRREETANKSTTNIPAATNTTSNCDAMFMIGKEWRRRTLGDIYTRSRKSLQSLRLSNNHSHLHGHNNHPLNNNQNPNFFTPTKSMNSASLSPRQPTQNTTDTTMNYITNKPKPIDTTIMPDKPIMHRSVSLGASNVIIQSLVRKRRDSMVKSPLNQLAAADNKLKPKEKWDPTIHGYRASLVSFANNHIAFTPPEKALPSSYKINTHRINPTTSTTSTTKMFTKQTYRTPQVNETTKQTLIANNNTNNNTTAINNNNDASSISSSTSSSSFGSKIWGLKVIDVRLLFTIQIRDVLFIYVIRCMDLFTSEGEPTPANSPSQTPLRSNTTAQEIPRRRPSSINLTKEKEKATLLDFLSVSEDIIQRSPSKKAGKLISRDNSPVPSRPRFDSEASDGTVTTMTKLMLQNPAKIPSRSSQQPSETIAQLLLNNNEEDIGLLKKVEDERRPSVSGRSSGYQTGGRKLVRDAGNGRRNSLINRSINWAEVRNLLDDEVVPSPPSSSPPPPVACPSSSPDLGPSAPPKSPKSPPTLNIKRTKEKPINQTFFLVECVDPQINFLDVNSHSSMIIVAGSAKIEGKRSNTAIIPPNHATNDPNNKQIEPKRKQEIKLQMDNVSAYTVPTITPSTSDMNNNNNDDQEDDVEDEVHWKTMSSMLNDDNHTISESSLMKMAIKDFEIHALYTFWTDVTAIEAKDLHITTSKDDLICAFRLELPDLGFDIYSWQFYIMMNVIRNVLLVPPPTQQRRNNANNDDNNNNKILQLSRNPDILAQYDFKSNLNNKLDINNKLSRDEIKILIEENLSSILKAADDTINGITHGSEGTARFVEVYIGRVTWILRTSGLNNNTPASSLNNNLSSFVTPPPNGNNNSNANNANNNTNRSDQELIESGFMGIFATLDFAEDRSISSLFEIQRFWAKNLDPGSDSFIFQDKTSIVKPILNDNQEICGRCGQEFLTENNSSHACTFHADSDGNPGEFKEMMMIDELTNQEIPIKAWSCCRRMHEYATGCTARPHSCKDVMFSIRAEVQPTTRIENIDIVVLKTLEISIFPGANYDLRLQLTRSLVDILHRYFSIENADNFDYLLNNSNANNSNPNTTTNNTNNPASDASEASELALAKPSFKANNTTNNNISSTKQSSKKKMNFLKYFSSSKQNNNNSHPNTPSNGNNSMIEASPRHRVSFTSLENSELISSTPALSTKRGSGVTRTSGGPDSLTAYANSNVTSSSATSFYKTNDVLSLKRSTSNPINQKRQEAVYIRYLRVGDINLDVSTAGFTINLDKFKAVMEPFFCRREVMDWKRLIWMFERHLVWSLTKNTASSGFTKLGEILRLKKLTMDSSISSSDDPESIVQIKKNILLGSPSLSASNLSTKKRLSNMLRTTFFSNSISETESNSSNYSQSSSASASSITNTRPHRAYTSPSNRLSRIVERQDEMDSNASSSRGMSSPTYQTSNPKRFLSPFARHHRNEIEEELEEQHQQEEQLKSQRSESSHNQESIASAVSSSTKRSYLTSFLTPK